MFEKFRKSITVAAEFGPVAAFFTFFQGRTTAFAIFFSLLALVMVIVAIWGFIHGKDLTSLAAFVSSFALLAGAIFTGLVAHSTKEDWMEMKRKQFDSDNKN